MKIICGRLKRGCKCRNFFVLLTVINSQREKSKEAYNEMVKFLFLKTIFAYVFKILYAGLQWYEGTTTWQISVDILESGTSEKIRNFDEDHPFH